MRDDSTPLVPDRAPEISVIIPAYGCRNTLAELLRRLDEVLPSLTAAYEVIFVDDRGPEEQWSVISALAARFPHVRGVRMARNFGQQIAITAGLTECRGAYAVVMDGDLQDPPEAIPLLWQEAQKGAEIVYASRVSGDPNRRVFGNRVYFWLMNALLGYRVDPGQGSFSLISRNVIDAYLRFGEPERHYLFILRWLGFDSAEVVYERHERTIGTSGYTFRTLLRHAANGLFFQSTAPLIWVLWLGIACAGGSALLGFYYLLNALIGRPPEGFTTLVVLQMLTSGMVLTCLGTTGLYIARIFDVVRNRPLYLLDRRTPEPPTPR